METKLSDATELYSLAQRLRGLVHTFFHARLNSVPEAEELTRTALGKLVLKLSKLRADDRLESWIFRTVRNALIDHVRGQYRRAEYLALQSAQNLLGAGEGTQSPMQREEERFQAELKEFIRAIVESLPAPYRDALRLTEYEGLTQIEVAERLNIPILTARAQVQRARHKLKNVIELCCYFEGDDLDRLESGDQNAPRDLWAAA